MLSVQTLVTMALVSASVLAPAVAPTLGVAPERIGLYVAAAYLAAMLVGLRAGQGVTRWGAMPLSQAALAVAAAGALLAGAGPPAALLVAAALIGVGYGLINPAAAAVLVHHAPARARGLFFSIKQTGVPIGVALAGLLMPFGLAVHGWRPSVLALGGACAAGALALGALGRRLEPPPSAPSQDGALALLKQVWRTPALRRLSLASLAYAMTQQTFVTFVVSLLNLRLGWSLAAAAAVLSASQALATLARIGFGALADRMSPARLLRALGAAMALCCLALAALAPGVPAAVAMAAALACAATAMGWNGVFFAELSQRVPRDAMARISGATQFFTFAGGMLGPLVFGEALRAGSGYAMAWTALAVVPAIAAWTLREPAAAEEAR
jgi:MFS family permease